MHPLVARASLIILLAAAAALPLIAPTYYLQFGTKVLTLGILAMALNLVVGFGGLVSICHGAFFGLAGYALALAAPKYEAASLWLTLPLAVGVAATAALAIGALSLRTRGIYFIMVTLAFGEMLFYLFHDNKFAGGSDGTFINIKPEAMLFGVNVIDLDKARVFYWVVLALVVLTILILYLLTRSPPRATMSGVRARSASPSTAYASRRSSSPERSPASPAISPPRSSASSHRKCSAGTSRRSRW